MVDLIKDIINEDFVKKHGLFGYNPPVPTYENREFDSFHDVYHIFAKSKAGLSTAYTNRPSLNTELLVNIYQVVMSRIVPMDAETARQGIPGKFDKTNGDLTLEEIKAHNLGRRENLEESYLAESRGVSLNMEKNDHSSSFYRQDNGALFDRISALPDHVIEYHTARASWLRENIYREYLREITDMTPVEIGNIDVNRVMSRELNGERINFEQWRTQYLEPYREQHSKSENLLVSYREYTKNLFTIF
jgi:hypothetical protein